MSHTERYQRDLSVLKPLTGGDLIHSHIKFVQGTIRFFNAATIVVVGNALFSCQDFSGALERRLRIIPGKGPVKLTDRICLLENIQGKWVGLLADELPVIFNWAFQISLKHALQHTLLYNLGAQHLEGLNRIKHGANNTLKPTGHFVKDPVHIGAKFSIGDQKAYYETQRRNALYPHDLSVCDCYGLPA